MTSAGGQSSARYPWAVVSLVLFNLAVFYVDQSRGGWLVERFALWAPGHGDFAPWQMITYGFLHANTLHLTVNMIGLWFIGRLLERFWGPSHFLVYYFFCVLGAAIVQIATGLVMNDSFTLIGASGGVFGLLLALGVVFPRVWIVLLFPPIPIQARYLVIIFGVVEIFMGVAGPTSGKAGGIAHMAHLGGMLFGYLLIQFWRGRLWLKPRRIQPSPRRGKP